MTQSEQIYWTEFGLNSNVLPSRLVCFNSNYNDIHNDIDFTDEEKEYLLKEAMERNRRNYGELNYSRKKVNA